MTLAVLTIHGWAGLLVQAVALSGAAGLLRTTGNQTRLQLEQLDSIEADGGSASVSEWI
jgi:hypothetical protein